MIRSRARRDDRGVFLLLFALCLTALLIFVAMAVDLGQARFSKRNEQQLADLASISAGREMAGYGSTSGGVVVSRPRDACLGAMASIQTNSNDFTPTSSQIDTACNLLPVTTASCTAATIPINATVIDEPYAVTVRWPIPDGELTDDSFFGDGVNDGTDQCTRLRIAVQRTDDTSFAGVIGVGSLTTSQSVVIRSTLANNNTIIPAFLMLERSECGVLTNSVSGAGNLGVQILGIPSTDQPGTIHIDSTADNSCGGSPSNSVAVYGTPLSSKAPSIDLHPAPSDPKGTGLLYVVATSNQADSVPDGVRATVLQGDVISRAPIDDEFESITNPAVTNLDMRARNALSTNITSDTVGDGWKRLTCNLDELDPTDTDVLNWYVRCDEYNDTTGRIDAVASTFGTTPNRIVFDGDVAVANSKSLSFATAAVGDVAEVTIKGKVDAEGSIQFGALVERIYVGGGDYVVSRKNDSAVFVSGSLQIRAASIPTLAADGSVATVCPTAAQTGGSAELVVYGNDGPSFNSSGAMAMCNTMVYLAGDTKSVGYKPQSTIGGGNCDPEFPCPKVGNVADDGYFEFTGIVDWTAPNATSGPPPSPRGLEDLIFWSESSGRSDTKAGARVVTQGIFFGPNMSLLFQSPAKAKPSNAQFISRKLELKQGTLFMLPSPNDSTPIPAPGSFAIIR